jgi:threonylcarbamoyladenosine tRNA methylthiotransferase MtaB
MSDQRPPRSVSFHTLGCKINQYETNDIERQFAEAGWRTVPFGEPADVAVVNTCTVTARSDQHCRAALRRARRASPAGVVIAAGCYAQAQAEALAALPEVDLVLGSAEKAAVLAHIDAEGRPRGARVAAAPLAGGARAPFVPIRAFARHTRAFVKIQDGCDARCSYCIVPLARGPNRSLPEGAVLAQVAALARAGHREIVLTGVHLGAWGGDLGPGHRLVTLLERVLAVPGLERLRLSSIEPTELTDDLLALLASSPAICPHLHIPLQSGAARVLRAMRRPYDPALFARLVERLAAALPDPGIGADVIAGFPGEDDAAHGETVALLRSLPLTYLHVFPYSRRPGTPAAGLPGQVPRAVRERRALELREIGGAKAGEFRARHVGRTVRALLEGRAGEDGSGAAGALTGNYLKVRVAAPAAALGRICDVRITAHEEGRLHGEIV